MSRILENIIHVCLCHKETDWFPSLLLPLPLLLLPSLRFLRKVDETLQVFSPSDQNTFCKKNSTNSKKLRMFFPRVGEKNEAQKKHKSRTTFSRGAKNGKTRGGTRPGDFLYKFDKRWEISAKISGGKRFSPKKLK